MIKKVLFAIALLWSSDNMVRCVRILEVTVPGHAAEGKEALLGCQFRLEGDMLYSVKWYKDGREFYRYVPKNNPQAAKFSTLGVDVDMRRSSSNVVLLERLTKESEGLYRCEVSGEAPLFTTAYQEKYITIHLLPEHGPRISGLQKHVEIGDKVFVNCTSPPSRPEVLLTWFLNDKPVPKKMLHGPWYRISGDRSDATITALQLRYVVKAQHFLDGVMKLKCQATVAPLYQQERSVSRTLLPIMSSTSTAVYEQKPDKVLKAFQDLSYHIRYGYYDTTPANPDFLTDDADLASNAAPKAATIILLLVTFILIT